VHGGERAGWLGELEREGRTEAGRRAERATLLETELLLAGIALRERTVGPEDVQLFFEQRFGPGGVRLSTRWVFLRLVIPSLPGEASEARRARSEELRRALAAEAEALRARLVAGEPFEPLARAHGDASSEQPGDLQLDLAAWPAEARAPVLALEVGGISPPVFVRGGFWLVQVLGRETTELAAVEAELARELGARPADAPELTRVAEEMLAAVAVKPLAALWSAPPGPPDEPVLAVGELLDARADYAAWLLAVRGEGSAREFAEERRLRTRAAEAGVSVERRALEARVQGELEKHAEEVAGSDAARFANWLASEGLSPETLALELGRRTEPRMLLEELVRAVRPPDEDDLRAEWERVHGPGGRSRELRWLRVDAQEPGPEVPADERAAFAERARAAALERAGDLRERVLAGEDFAALARLHSDDPATRERGGVPPGGGRVDALPEELRAAVLELPAGGVSAPLPAGKGWLLVEVTARRDVPFDAVRDELARALAAAPPDPVRVAAFKTELYSDLAVEVLPALAAPPGRDF
jgi:parvulin-like peptidyl-prolyl isomerase